MPKRRAKEESRLDIFDDDVMGDLRAATAVAPPDAAPPLQQPVEKPDKVVEIPPAARNGGPKQPRAAGSKAGRGRADASPKADSAPEIAPQSPVLEPNVSLKFRVPQSHKSDFGRFKADLGAALGVSLDDSNIGRAIIELFLMQESERILQAAKEHRGEVKRPRNDDPVAMAEFDDWLGRIFTDAKKRRRQTQRADA